MSAPKFNVFKVDLDTMTVTHIGRITSEHALHHPSGWVFVTLDGATFLRTDKDPVWRKISDERTHEIAIRSAAD